ERVLAAFGKAETSSYPGSPGDGLTVPVRTEPARQVDPLDPEDSSGWVGLRYQILRRHARGGLGEVFVAQDESLHREVALKAIRSEYAEDLRCQARFLREAEITGGLEHPGIVPIYGLGRHPDGRPFYVMPLIRGNSLHEVIQQFHQTGTSDS